MYDIISTVYFSPTGNSKKSVEAMADALGKTIAGYDVTVKPASNQYVFGSADFVIFGAPVYGGRIPKIAAERFANFRGNQTPCIVAVTYGNRHYDDALLELSDLATAQGFTVKGAAALVGRHTFGEIQVERPDEQDLDENRKFALQALQNGKDTINISGNRPYKDGGNGGKFRPLTDVDTCTACGLCVRSCPMQAIDADCKTIGSQCISCFRCIRICPVGAKNMNTDSYNSFAKDFSAKLSEKRANEYFI